MQWPISRTRPRADEAEPVEAKRDSALDTARFILFLALAAWAFRSFIAQPFSIPSGSMQPTLYIGDYVTVAKWPYGFSRYSFPLEFPPINGRLLSHLPERGDVVVFRHPTEDADLIKRVIGLPGDTIQLRGGVVILNGQPLQRQARPPYRLPISDNTPCKVVPPASPVVTVDGDRPYCVMPAYFETLPGGRSYTVLDQVAGLSDEFPRVTVPAGHVFLMGDNRDDSLDSRFPASERGVGMVPVENLIGRASFTIWSTDGGASYWKPWTWFSSLRGSRIGNGYNGEAE